MDDNLLGRMRIAASVVLTALVMLAVATVPFSADAAPAFTDIEGHWARSTIEHLHELDVVYAISDDQFSPDQPITRLDFARWVVRSLGDDPLDEPLDFIDAESIPSEARGEVARAVQRNLIEGYPDGSFAPTDTVTRIQMATILGRILEQVGVIPRPRYLVVFDDAEEIPEWGTPAAAAVETRLIIGREAFRVFAPNDPTTRAEAAEMLSRFMEVLRELDEEGRFAPPELDKADPDPGYLVAGYYMGRDEFHGESYRSVDNFGSHIDMVIMSTEYGFQIDDDSLHLSGYDSDFLFSRASGDGEQAVLVRITNSFDPDVSDRILNDARFTEEALAAIEDVLARGYDGVNINFEDVRPADREAMSAFMASLWRRIGSDYLVTMAVPATAEDNPQHGWSGAFDYASLGESGHYLIPMAYDKHWRTSAPGPVAPLNWVRDVLQYTVSVVEPDRVLMGAPFYGYDWLDTGQPNPARPVRWNKAAERAEEFGATIEWCDAAEGPFYRYTCEEGDARIVYFENAESLRAKMELVPEYGLAGVAFWRLGQEGSDAWPVIRDTLK